MGEADYERKVIESLVDQFAYPAKKNGRAAICTGGLSALETAFAYLGWDDPHLTPERECQWPRCHEEGTCGACGPRGYKRLCYKHLIEYTQEAEQSAEHETI